MSPLVQLGSQKRNRRNISDLKGTLEITQNSSQTIKFKPIQKYIGLESNPNARFIHKKNPSLDQEFENPFHSLECKSLNGTTIGPRISVNNSLSQYQNCSLCNHDVDENTANKVLDDCIEEEEEEYRIPSRQGKTEVIEIEIGGTWNK